jgi:hypothetical protein
MTLVLLKPLIQIEVVVLLAPEHSRQRLAVHRRSSSFNACGVIRS